MSARTTAPSTPGVRSERPTPPSKLPRTIGLLVSGAIVVVCAVTLDAQWSRLLEAPGVLGNYLRLMSQGIFTNPTVEPASFQWTSAFEYMLESLQMAWMGTLIGAVLSFPLAFLAARTIAPAPVVFVTRMVLNVIRAIPELILAIVVMMPIFGLGPLAGALALGIGSIGTLGKLSSEAIEAIDSRPVEAVSATGARKAQVLAWGVIPQAMPEILAFWLYRFEINIRAGAILGAVGAGGIGSILKQLFDKREWDRIGVTLVVIILVTILVDQISAWVRHRIIAGSGHQRAEVDTAALLG
ncbi:phosphonate ABC transporter, inner membrane subunit [Beutenbergia cavernae DSM 12333]|uniref:Phosphonate ABC transporter, inner membrane subunit n=1 Tax=Beutenbergia cavernae (strain ATCC BAA-8 / DSM 12333 / CCUG 43141 / JCM 11478 / NBRC 16432 / NCIMB 13614 / HKI 0122) TaxID=471853 RepID=C5BXN7_BEUC1|nr:phosphonate ABC transporter, permease protein PhnE [Beutenbergia cavernae]ACQ80920.1 phosphonate ABC transporter, inner membrane subunit [Beutenbergia cavernae DSM 12333]